MTTLFSFLLLLHTALPATQRPVSPPAGETDLYFVVFLRPAPDRPRLAAADPTVVEHRNTVEVFAWQGPRGIGVEYKRLHAEHPDTPDGMGVQPLFLMHRAAGMKGTDARLKAHTDYVDRLRAEGKIAAAGLTEGAGDLFSLVVFNRIGDEEAARLVANDPAVKSGALRAEAHRWWCAEHVLPGRTRVSGL